MITSAPSGGRQEASFPTSSPSVTLEIISIKSRRISESELLVHGWRGPTLIETAVEHVLGDTVFQHFDRAADDHPAACAPHAIFDERLAWADAP